MKRKWTPEQRKRLERERVEQFFDKLAALNTIADAYHLSQTGPSEGEPGRWVYSNLATLLIFSEQGPKQLTIPSGATARERLAWVALYERAGLPDFADRVRRSLTTEAK